MSETALPVKTDVIPEPTEADLYAWVIQYPTGDGVYLTTAAYPTDGRDPEVVARQYDPRQSKGNEGMRAVLVKITVPLTELRRLP